MLKILIAEDDLMIADMIETVLIGAGYTVYGIGRTVTAAVELARIHKPDLAVIDFHLADDGLGTEITAQLAPLGGLGVLYATGNVATELPRISRRLFRLGQAASSAGSSRAA